MDFPMYLQAIERLPFGKRLPGAVYIHAEALGALNNDLSRFVEELRSRLGAGEAFNLIKFHLGEFKLSFLSYPDFYDNPHPELCESLTAHLATGRVRRHDYSKSQNPPILHRKETFLAPDHPLADVYRALTQAEEAEGLYEENHIIGFKRNWETLLLSHGLTYEGHRLVRTEGKAKEEPEDNHVAIDRHKTAILRNRLSRPVKTLLEHGFLSEEASFLDYGCGQGDDVNRLKQMGFMVSAWDPVYYPDGLKEPADIVNLGFVLNVIEDPIERTAVLHAAYELSRKLLVVSTLIATSSTPMMGRPYKDGILTSRNTFQKYFRQDELERYIEDVLDASAVAVGLGIFYIFHSPSDQQEFLANRTRRTINWVDISRRIRPPKVERPRQRRLGVYERNAELLDSFWSKMLEMGRVPTKDEFERYDDLRKEVGSATKAKNMFVQRFGEETLSKAFELRRNDLHVYLALSNFRRKVPPKHLPAGLRLDIKTFLGRFKQAMEESQALLFSAGNPELITKLCDETPFGFLDQQALYIHRSLVQELHPVLRIYVGCAEVLYGDLRDVDIVKIHKQSGKVSLLKYDDFDGKPLPELQERVKVNLRRQFIEVFDHRSPDRQEILYFKERYVSKDHRKRAMWEEFSRHLQSLDMDLGTGYGPSKQELLSLLAGKGLTIDFEKAENSAEVNEQE